MFKRCFVLLSIALLAMHCIPMTGCIAEEMPVVTDIAILDNDAASVRSAQRCLIRLGLLNANATGINGPKTQAALRAFQEQNGLEATGQLDATTLALLKEQSPAEHSVVEVQKRLAELGYLYGAADGIWGAGSKGALTAFQRINGLDVTGTSDKATLAALFSDGAVALPDALFVGSRGDKVEALQATLKRLCFFSGKPDGDYGKTTANAVLSFQKHLISQGIAEGISATGTATSVTLYYLYSADYSSYLKDVAVGTTGPEARRIEKRLAVLGYLDQKADETFDAFAEEALQLFQDQAGLPRGGVADRETVDALFAQDAPLADRCVPHPISSGESGIVIREVEQVLLTGGMTMKLPDGKFDASVEEALARLYACVPSDPRFSDPTRLSREAVEALLDGRVDIPATDDPTRIRRRLYSLYYMSREDAEAQSESATAAALRALQAANGLTETGEADGETLALLFTPAAAAKPYPYRVEVSLAEQTVTVSSLDQNGEYRRVKAFPCSTGLHDTTPRGIFLDGHPVNRWHYFEKYFCWAQYSFRIEGGILFHSVLYREQDENTLKVGSVWALGSPASHGCIRLQVEDAKWLFEHCERGSLVIVIS